VGLPGVGQVSEALNGHPGRAKTLVSLCKPAICLPPRMSFYNSLEAPALNKYPLLALFQEFLKANGAVAALMSGSGSTTFALVRAQSAGEQLRENFQAKFGENHWTALVPL